MTRYCLTPRQRRWLWRRMILDRIDAAQWEITVSFGLIVFSAVLATLLHWTSP